MNGCKTLVGAIVALVAELGRLNGLELGDHDGIVNSVLVIGGVALAIYGRVVATKRLTGDQQQQKLEP